MQKILNKFTQASSYAGLGLILMGLNDLFKIKELEPMITATQTAAETVQATGNPIYGIGALAMGVFAIFRDEAKK